ncbi:threonine synthase, partial [Campylobacter coli]|nr:threonine synthase [Campylobacter coli]
FGRECKDEKADFELLAKEFKVDIKKDLLELFDLKNADEKVYEIGDIEGEILEWIKK